MTISDDDLRFSDSNVYIGAHIHSITDRACCGVAFVGAGGKGFCARQLRPTFGAVTWPMGQVEGYVGGHVSHKP